MIISNMDIKAWFQQPICNLMKSATPAIEKLNIASLSKTTDPLYDESTETNHNHN